MTHIDPVPADSPDGLWELILANAIGVHEAALTSQNTPNEVAENVINPLDSAIEHSIENNEGDPSRDRLRGQEPGVGAPGPGLPHSCTELNEEGLVSVLNAARGSETPLTVGAAPAAGYPFDGMCLGVAL